MINFQNDQKFNAYATKNSIFNKPKINFSAAPY